MLHSALIARRFSPNSAGASLPTSPEANRQNRESLQGLRGGCSLSDGEVLTSHRMDVCLGGFNFQLTGPAPAHASGPGEDHHATAKPNHSQDLFHGTGHLLQQPALRNNTHQKI